MTPALEARQLSRYYDRYAALAETSFAISANEIVVLTGPNGAGKSTLLLCLSSLLLPTSGTIQVGGYDLYNDEVEAKKRLAFVPDVPRYYSELTAWEHLQFLALAYHADQGFETRAKEILGDLNLWEARDLYPHNYSRGMRLKLGLALALIHPFQVLLLDEPTSALDPQAVAYVKDKLRDLRAQGAAILLSSHDPAIVQEMHARHWHMDRGILELDA
ncbi:MAG: ABC transporter ATP-binding protein [Chloroflexi bacterium]|nr:ABC transporter ATP-binding protein [Chloroflexota bacterium]